MKSVHNSLMATKPVYEKKSETELHKQTQREKVNDRRMIMNMPPVTMFSIRQ